MPVLVVRDRESKALFKHLVPSKGVEHLYSEQALFRDVKFLGYQSVIIKSDQEPAIKAVMGQECICIVKRKGATRELSQGRSPWQVQRRG